MDAPGRSHLSLKLRDRGLKYSNQRTRTKLLDQRRNVLQALGLAESTHKASTLRSCPPDQPPFGENYRPGKHAEAHQQEKDGLRNRTRLKDEIDNFAADK